MSANNNHPRNHTLKQLHNEDSGYSGSPKPLTDSEQQLVNMMSYAQLPQHPPAFQAINSMSTTIASNNDPTLGEGSMFSAGDSNFWDSYKGASFSPAIGQDQGNMWGSGAPSVNIRNGQPTPPQDMFSPGDSGKEGKPKSRKRSRTSTDSGSRRKSRGNAKPDLDEEDISHLSPEELAQREKFLERNRVAASKCRQKKKEWTNSLEEKARELQGQREMLVAYISMLRNELLMLKCKCLEHADCDCVGLREYLKNTVATLPPASAELYSANQPTNDVKDDPLMPTYDDESYGDMVQDSRSRSDASPNLDFLKFDSTGQS
ncbi:hypothetical protein FKW77_006106 [Venturia effusa]|uniref:BZIP domain-containing protein n=1 Tax=Venturia effusa TaxID=50376 RepID=A0A517LP59_9PEZI|nr:hypothetical protein FKW77_006106 [Venturia effusa]